MAYPAVVTMRFPSPRGKRQFTKPTLDPIGLEVGKILTVYYRCALVGAPLGGVGMCQDVVAADLFIQGIEAILGFCLRFRVHGRSAGSQTAMGNANTDQRSCRHLQVAIDCKQLLRVGAASLVTGHPQRPRPTTPCAFDGSRGAGEAAPKGAPLALDPRQCRRPVYVLRAVTDQAEASAMNTVRAVLFGIDGCPSCR